MCLPDAMNYGKKASLSRTPSRNDNMSESLNMADDMEEDGKNHKRVNRNLSEKKRRDQFNVLVNELCSMVSSNNKKMDKSTVLKSTIAYLKSYQETAVQAQAHEIKEDWKPSFLSNDEFMHLMLEALDSFLLVFTQQGNILYASESVTSLLGHLPSDLINKPVHDFIHESEKQNLYNVLFHYNMTSDDLDKDGKDLNFTCPFKRGTLAPDQEQLYELVKFTGFKNWSSDKIYLLDDSESFFSDGLSSKESDCFCCIVKLQNSRFIREMSMVDEAKSEFTSRHSLEWKFLFLDHRAPPIIGYLPFEVLGTSGYDYYHPDDLDMMQTGEGTSCFYRFLTKGQQWIWIKTRYYITYHQWTSKPEFIVCTNKVISYADVREQTRREMGFDGDAVNGNSENGQRMRSPSVCSVTSGGFLKSHFSSSHSQCSSETDRTRQSDKDSVDSSVHPHSTSVGKGFPAVVSQQLQMLIQQRLLHQQQRQEQHPTQDQQSMKQSSVSQQQQQSQTHQQQRPSVVITQHLAQPSQPVVSPPSVSVCTPSPSSSLLGLNTSSGQRQIFLTPIQQQLHEQLRQKSIRLQQAIIRQQEELRQITQQLNLTQQGMMPIIPVPSPGSPLIISPAPVTTMGDNSMLQGIQLPAVSQMMSLHPQAQLTLDQPHFMPFHSLQQESDSFFSQGSESPLSPQL
ncbi:hypothetical protein KUTeg_024984 [Tegillarca granosa]|uniref:Clock n=1 Tax=Tegillarca granosa TaxID=220873 RepID=A0ABQ9E568_TEGGR|nr:hypothetical protein KUTeg_024984 [Tegillarca granosa]